MNPWQMAQQVKHKLTTAIWPTGAREPVFGLDRVRVFAGSPTEEHIPTGFPWCLVVVGAGDPDEDHPQFIQQTFDVIAGVSVFGDPMGEFAVIGGPSGDLGASDSRGVAEISTQVRAAVEDLNAADGAKVQITATRIDTSALVGSNRHLVLEALTLTALCTSNLHYASPQSLVLTGSDLWTWEGSHCLARFDFLKYRMLEKVGTIPSLDPDDGTLLYTGTDPTTVQFGDPGNTYTVFCDYSSRKQTGVIEGTSEPEVGSYRVVT